jgi:hypothetical protein
VAATDAAVAFVGSEEPVKAAVQADLPFFMTPQQ